MFLIPLPLPDSYKASASWAAGLTLTLDSLVDLSHSQAPKIKLVMSIPCRVAGNRPTADNSLVRPPTQSHIGNRVNHLFCTACLSSSLPLVVMATACCPK